MDNISLCNKYHDNVSLQSMKFEYFKCKDMSVKDTDKEYIKCTSSKCIEDPCFGYIQVYMGNKAGIKVTTPIMKCPFGLQSQGNNHTLTLQFTDVDDDPYMKSFLEWISEVEFRQMKFLGLTEDTIDLYNSQIKYDKKNKYDPNIPIKLPFSYNKFHTDIYSNNHSAVNIFYLKQKFIEVQCDIYIDKIWKYNDQFICKWKMDCIHLL